MTAPAPLGLNVINNHIAKWAPSRHDDASWLRACIGWRPARHWARQPSRPTWFRPANIDLRLVRCRGRIATVRRGKVEKFLDEEEAGRILKAVA
jgi:hypothetical protein